MSVEQLSLGPKSQGLKKVGVYWYRCIDGDEWARQLFCRHYSKYHYKDGREPKLFVGPGYKVVLVTETGDALFVWRKFKDASGQKGINCSVFRNEGDTLSSTLILDAERVAWDLWPNERLYTYVNPKKIKSSNPGACFKHAGWVVCGRTIWKNLVILEKQPL